jgi:hypothetical protein
LADTDTHPKAILCLIAVATGIFYGLQMHSVLWQLDENGLSSITAGKTPYWDFANLWAGGKLAASGNVALLFDVETYRGALREMLSPVLADQEWSYPPSILLIGVPLSLLPLSFAYILWTLGSVLALYLACRTLNLSRVYCVAVCLSPVVFYNALLGQNGTLTASLLVTGLANLQRRPILGGMLIGLLSIKPHLGILLPFCLLAGGYYAAFFSAALTCLVMILATGLLFGFDTWLGFWDETRMIMTAILEAPFPQGYHASASTIFSFSRGLGADLPSAYLVQAIATATALVLAIWLWSRKPAASAELRVPISAGLALIATPYGYVYDAVALAIGAVILARYSLSNPQATVIPFVALALWFMPVFTRMVFDWGYSVGAIFLVLAVAVLMKDAVSQATQSNGSLREPVRAS